MKQFFFKILFVLLLSPICSQAQAVYELKFTTGGTTYHAAMYLLDNGVSKMRVKYFREKTQKTEMVEQTMEVKSTENGIYFYGYDPVFPGTKTKCPNYNLDNFLLANGNIYCVDDHSAVSTKTSIRVVTDASEKKLFLSGFDWVLK